MTAYSFLDPLSRIKGVTGYRDKSVCTSGPDHYPLLTLILLNNRFFLFIFHFLNQKIAMESNFRMYFSNILKTSCQLLAFSNNSL
jgi:hypothetical protein